MLHNQHHAMRSKFTYTPGKLTNDNGKNHYLKMYLLFKNGGFSIAIRKNFGEWYLKN